MQERSCARLLHVPMWPELHPSWSIYRARVYMRNKVTRSTAEKKHNHRWGVEWLSSRQCSRSFIDALQVKVHCGHCWFLSHGYLPVFSPEGFDSRHVLSRSSSLGGKCGEGLWSVFMSTVIRIVNEILFANLKFAANCEKCKMASSSNTTVR